MVKTTGLAVLTFAIALVVGSAIGSRSDTVSTTTTSPPRTTTTLEPRAVFVSPEETVVGPVVIVATEPILDRNQVMVGFDLYTRAPTADVADVNQQLGFGNTLLIPPEDLNTVFIDRWVLRTVNGDIEGAAANPSARAARFDVGEDFDIGTVTEVAITSYAVLTPVSASVDLAVGSESAQVAPGVIARLLAVTEQANTIVQIELVSERGFNLDNMRIIGTGPGWLSAVREAEGRPRWNLTFDAETAPSPIAITVEGSVWVPVDEELPVSLAEAE